ncbi:hypothetical protein LEL_07120 [Akanthomyces lecanii RCEF 1005]|uniref:Protein kinase-like domain protein n=1 Tax=Akanthomyces lecanii RCEF 1005 TaxID=1081108 RepID=A0A162JXV6_CORDF|nr:hypothetical protein LEL_07120 [Akanthomyces lecanii RCEF 1005]
MSVQRELHRHHPGSQTTWHIVDWDQRRTFGVTVEQYRFDEELAVDYLYNHIDQIDADACHLFITPDGQLVRTSASPEDDVECCVEYFPVADHHPAPRVSTICRSQLEELDILGANVDLVCYREDGASEPKQFQDRLWDEMYLWMRLPEHPNIVTFDRVVTDELEGRVVGFTSRFIKGDTLEKNTSRPFKLKHPRQLMDVVDELSLNIMLFDFDNSAAFGQRCYWEDRDGVKGLIFTVYEIITEDMSLRSVPFDEQNMHDITALKDWPKQPHVKLDHPVSDYRALVTDWAL